MFPAKFLLDTQATCLAPASQMTEACYHRQSVLVGSLEHSPGAVQGSLKGSHSAIKPGSGMNQLLQTFFILLHEF